MNRFDFSIIHKDCERLTHAIEWTAFRNKTILVTGANGLIGGFLSDFFCYLNDQYDLQITLFLTSYSAPHKARRLTHLLGRSDVTYFSWDSATPFPTGAPWALVSPQIDYCFFCSGYGQPSKFLQDGVKTALLNVVGPESILRYMQTAGGGKFLYMSSSEIYGNTPCEEAPTKESYPVMFTLQDNRCAYKVAKALGEVICNEYDDDPALTVRIARVALAYGPGTLWTDQRVLQEFIFKAQDFHQIEMLDAGTAVRNYLYITDCCEILLNCLISGRSVVYNVGGDTESISIYELAQKIGTIFDVPVICGTTPTEVVRQAPPQVSLSMERYREEFPMYGKNIIPLDRGLRNVVQWYKLGAEN